MNPFDPLDLFHLAGDGTMRNVTLALPTERVRTLLPHGLELGSQDLTPEGTHPIVLGFHDMFRLHTSFPSLLPSLSYHEHSVGIPFSYVTNGRVSRDSPGPYFFMPLLLLDSALATIGGIAFWGFPKRLASFDGNAEKYVVSYGGQQVAHVEWTKDGEHKPIAEYEFFEAHRQVISQPLLGLVPLSMGPFFAAAEFPKRWDVATVRPLKTTTTLYSDYVPGLPSSRSKSPGVDASVIGSYELRAPWRVSMPYPPGNYQLGRQLA